MTKEEALRLALDTLKEVRDETFRLLRNGEKLYAEDKVWSTIITIQEALETKDKPVSCAECGADGGHALYCVACAEKYVAQTKTKDEPVAWMNRHGACKTSLFIEMEAGAKEEYTIPVYTHPKEWVGLKDDDEIPWDGVDAKSFARAIEAKLKEKNT